MAMEEAFGTIAPSFRMGSMHHGATQEQMRHMRRASHLKLGFHSRPRRIQIVGKGSQFPHEGILVFFPLKYLLNRLGGIPVPFRKGAELTSAIVSRFNGARYMNLAVTPEGDAVAQRQVAQRIPVHSLWSQSSAPARGHRLPLEKNHNQGRIFTNGRHQETDMRFCESVLLRLCRCRPLSDKFAVSDLNQP